MDRPPAPGALEAVLWITAGILLAMLSAAWKLLAKDDPPGPIPRRVWVSTILGGLLAGILMLALMLHFFGYSHPWLMVAMSIPAGLGSTMILAAAANAAAAWVKRKIERLEGKDIEK